MLLLRGFLSISVCLVHLEEKGQRTVFSFNKQDLKSWLHINTAALGLAVYSELKNQASNLSSRKELEMQLLFL